MNHDIQTRRGRRRDGRRRGRRAVLLTAAGVAVGLPAVGIAGTMAGAAWQDAVVFTAPAQAANFDLAGSLDGTTWAQGSSIGTAIAIPAATFAGITPGDSIPVTLRVRNTGNVAVALTSSVTPSGALFTDPAKATASVSGLAAMLAGGATDDFVLTVTAPDWTALQHVGDAGTVQVLVSGSVG
jgi:hypothetical protein